MKNTILTTFLTALISAYSYSMGFAIDNGNRVDSVTIGGAVVRLYGLGCSGVLVSPSWIITAPHCVSPGDPSRPQSPLPEYADRTIPKKRDIFFNKENHNGRFNYIGEKKCHHYNECVEIDRLIHVDGESTLTNSVALVRLEQPVPPFVPLRPIYSGVMPDVPKTVEIWGFGGGKDYRQQGAARLTRKRWIEIDQYWGMCLEAAPNSTQDGDSGGPVILQVNGRKEVLGTTIGLRPPHCPAGQAAATFDIGDKLISDDLQNRIMEPQGHSLYHLDVLQNGKNDIVMYDRFSGKLSLLGMDRNGALHILLEEEIDSGYDFIEVGDFNGDGLSNEIVFIRGTGQIKNIDYFNFTTSSSYHLNHLKSYSTASHQIEEVHDTNIDITASFSGSFLTSSRYTTEIGLVERKSGKIHFINVVTGAHLGTISNPFFRDAQTYSTGKFIEGHHQGRDWLAISRASIVPDETVLNGRTDILIVLPYENHDGKIRLQDSINYNFSVKGTVSQIVPGTYDDDISTDIFLYKHYYDSRVGMQKQLEIVTKIATQNQRSAIRILNYDYKMIVGGNFDEDNKTEVLMFRHQNGLSVETINPSSQSNRKTYNWPHSRWNLVH